MKKMLLILCLGVLIASCGDGKGVELKETKANKKVEKENTQTEAYEVELSAGHYVVGVDIPAGIYDITAIKGTGNVSSSNMYDGGINQVMGTQDDGVSVKEFKNLTETLTAYDKNRNSLKREKRYTDSSYSNGILKSYKNDKLVDEIVFENSMPKLKKMYYDDGNLAFEFPLKDGKIHGEAKKYYRSGKIREVYSFKNGKREGIGREYSETGEIIKESLYKDNEEIKKIK